MPDYAMCLGEGCASREQCYRHMAVPKEWHQAYHDFRSQIVGDRCPSFWPLDQAVTAVRSPGKEPAA